MGGAFLRRQNKTGGSQTLRRRTNRTARARAASLAGASCTARGASCRTCGSAQPFAVCAAPSKPRTRTRRRVRTRAGGGQHDQRERERRANPPLRRRIILEKGAARRQYLRCSSLAWQGSGKNDHEAQRSKSGMRDGTGGEDQPAPSPQPQRTRGKADHERAGGVACAQLAGHARRPARQNMCMQTYGRA